MRVSCVFEGTLTIFRELRWFWDFGGQSLCFMFLSGQLRPLYAFLCCEHFLVDKVALLVVSLILASWTAWLPCKAFLYFCKSCAGLDSLCYCISCFIFCSCRSFLCFCLLFFVKLFDKFWRFSRPRVSTKFDCPKTSRKYRSVNASLLMGDLFRIYSVQPSLESSNLTSTTK